MDAQLKLSQLQADIRLLERQRELLLADISSIQQSKDRTVQEANADLAKLRNEKKALIEATARLRDETEQSADSLVKTQSNITHFSEDEAEKTKTDYLQKQEEIAKKEEHAEKIAQMLGQRERVLVLREAELVKREQAIEEKEALQGSKRAVLAQEEQRIDNYLDQSNAQLAKTAEKVRLLEEQIMLAEEKLLKTELQIKNMTEITNQMNKDAQDQLEKSLKLQKELDWQKEMQEKKEEELHLKEIRLEDREQTLKRNLERISNG